jgi:hypothetical protein
MVTRERIGTGTGLALGSVLFFLLGAAASGQEAGNYPNKSVTMIVPFAPGGASDFVARTLQPGVSQILGQQIVVDNRLGAAGIVGTEAAARAAPDGYTAFLGNVGTISINPAVYSDMRVKPDKDLAPVSICADTPSILITRPDFPANTVGELVAYVKAHQGKVTFASPGSSTLNRLEMEVFKKDAGLDMVHVPYKGGAAPGGDGRSRRTRGHDVHHDVLGDGTGQGQEGQGAGRHHPGANRQFARHTDHVRTRMEEPGDIVLAGRAGAIRDAAADRREAARGDCQGARRSGNSGAHAQKRRDRRHQQVAGGIQGLYGR